MRALMLLGSPRQGRNTDSLAGYAADELERRGAKLTTLAVRELDIAPCLGCYACQQVSGEYGCVQRDDMYRVTEALQSCELAILATPIYTWYCPSGLKAALDRLYGMNKYYGTGEGRLWHEGLQMALLLTYGYEQEDACGPFVRGVQRLCEHSGIGYAGMYGLRDLDDLASFTTPAAEAGARAFARGLMGV
ncbi:MAG: flavodoxin family protein [Clostridia bacterium]|nr:flavodoxin family protein [Clostridia bacterium]